MKSLAKINARKYLYFAVTVEAVAVLLTMAGFLQGRSLLYLTAGLAVYMALLPPAKALVFFILSVPWFAVIPVFGLERLQNWRVLALELFLIYIWHHRRALAEALKNSAPRQALRKLALHFNLSKIDYAFYAFLAAGAVSLLDAEFKEAGLRYILWLLNIYLVFLVARQTLSRLEAKREVLAAASFSAVTLVASGFVQLFLFLRLPLDFFWQMWSKTVIGTLYGGELVQITAEFNSWFCYEGLEPVGLRMFSFFPGSHYFALFAILALPFAVNLQKSHQKRAWVLITGLLLAVILSGVRGAWLSVAAPLVLALLVFLFRKKLQANGRKLLVVLLLFIAMFAVTPLLQSALTSVSLSGQGGCGLWSRAASSGNLTETSNAQRLEIWRASWQSFSHNPALGLGLGNFPLVFGPPQPGQSFAAFVQEDDPIIGIPKKYLSAHNLYLQLLSETGLLGLAAFLAFVFYVLLAAWKKGLSGFSVAFVLAFGWALAYGVFDVVFLYSDKVQIFFWLGLALLVNSDQEKNTE